MTSALRMSFLVLLCSRQAGTLINRTPRSLRTAGVAAHLVVTMDILNPSPATVDHLIQATT